MWFLLDFLLTNVVGLAAVFAALVLWRRARRDPSGRLGSRRGLGTLCALAGGAGFVLGAHWKLIAWFPASSWLPPGDLGFLSPGSTVFLAACAVLLAIGVALLGPGRPAEGSPTAHAHANGPLGWVPAAALIITLAEVAAVEDYEYEFNQSAPGAPIEDSTIVHKMPARMLVANPIQAGRAYAGDYEFSPASDRFFKQHIPVWKQALKRYQGKPDVQYLEVGLFEGQSALWMLENILTHPTARLTGVDPFADPFYSQLEGSPTQTYKEVFYSNLKASGSQQKARIIEGISQIELRKLPLGSFDVIYIDGSHLAPDVLEDAILAWRLLKNGGILIFDDYLLGADVGHALDAFFAFFGDQFELVHREWQVIMTKQPPGASSPDEPG